MRTIRRTRPSLEAIQAQDGGPIDGQLLEIVYSAFDRTKLMVRQTGGRMLEIEISQDPPLRALPLFDTQAQAEPSSSA